jgi:hypothetical protein
MSLVLLGTAPESATEEPSFVVEFGRWGVPHVARVPFDLVRPLPRCLPALKPSPFLLPEQGYLKTVARNREGTAAR